MFITSTLFIPLVLLFIPLPLFYPFIFFIYPIHFIEFDHTGDIYGNRDQRAWRTKLQRSDVSNIIVGISHNSMECIFLKRFGRVLNQRSIDYETTILSTILSRHYINLMFFVLLKPACCKMLYVMSKLHAGK